MAVANSGTIWPYFSTSRDPNTKLSTLMHFARQTWMVMPVLEKRTYFSQYISWEHIFLHSFIIAKGSFYPTELTFLWKISSLFLIVYICLLFLYIYNYTTSKDTIINNC